MLNLIIFQNFLLKFKSLEIVAKLTEIEETFCRDFMERDGLKIFQAAFTTFQEYLENEDATPMGRIRVIHGEEMMLRILVNVSCLEDLAKSIAFDQPLFSSLKALLAVDIDAGNDSRPWLAGIVASNLILHKMVAEDGISYLHKN